MDQLSTILIEPDCFAIITENGDIQIQINVDKKQKMSTELDPIQLSIFSHRFMSIAEQMGRILQRTSISVNIKERYANYKWILFISAAQNLFLKIAFLSLIQARFLMRCVWSRW